MADFLYGINPIREAFLGEGRKPLELLVVSGDRNDRLDNLVVQAKQQQLKINYFDRRELDRLAGHTHHQGILLKLTPFGYTNLTTFLQNWRASGQVAFFLLLDGITDPHNFGAILRSALPICARASSVSFRSLTNMTSTQSSPWNCWRNCTIPSMILEILRLP